MCSYESRLSVEKRDEVEIVDLEVEILRTMDKAAIIADIVTRNAQKSFSFFIKKWVTSFESVKLKIQ